MLKRFLALLLALLVPCAALADTLTLLTSPIKGANLVSCSPDGSIKLYGTGNSLTILREDGSMLPVTANEARGVADAYGNLALIARNGAKVIGSEGVVWSPDSRYAALVNQNYVVMNAQFVFDPIVIDMQTGEMFLLAVYPNNARTEGAGVVLTATFSADSKYLYAVVMGGTKSAAFSLVQYDLKTLEATTLYTWEEMTYWPHLVQLADGSFLLMKETSNRNDFPGLMHITNVGGYTHTITDFNQRIMYFYPRFVQYSAASGHALIFGNGSQGRNAYTNLLHLRPDESLSLPEQYWAVPSLNADSIALRSKEEIQSPSTVMIRAVCLAQDGERALLLCSEGAEFALRMLNLSDGALTPVTGVDNDRLNSICAAGTPYVAWFGDVVLLGSSPLYTRAYQLN